MENESSPYAYVLNLLSQIGPPTTATEAHIRAHHEQLLAEEAEKYKTAALENLATVYEGAIWRKPDPVSERKPPVWSRLKWRLQGIWWTLTRPFHWIGPCNCDHDEDW